MEIEKLILKLMETNDFFIKFERIEIQELLQCCSAAVFEDKQTIFKEEAQSKEFYIIISGSALVTKKGKRIDTVKEGECIGEMGALTGETRSATVEAFKKVILLKIDTANLELLSPGVQAKLFKNIALLISNRLRKRLSHVH